MKIEIEINNETYGMLKELSSADGDSIELYSASIIEDMINDLYKSQE